MKKRTQFISYLTCHMGASVGACVGLRKLSCISIVFICVKVIQIEFLKGQSFSMTSLLRGKFLTIKRKEPYGSVHRSEAK